MNKIKCYINDNYIDILKNNKIKHIKLDSINQGNITDYKLFIKEIKKEKVFSSLFTYSLDLLLNKIIKEKDIIYYKLIFEELNCNNINILSTSKLLDNNTLIVNKDYYILYTNNNYYYIEYPLLTYYINYYDISKLKAISIDKINTKSKVKIYYYNNNEIFFLN